jgi:hypothetical protein
MSDQTPPPPPPPQEPDFAPQPAAGSNEPNPYAANPRPAADPYAATPYAASQSPYTGAGGPPPKQTLSLTSFILGLAAFVLGWIPFLGFLISVAAIILGFLAMSKEKSAPKWMWIVGLIGGFLGLIGSLIFTGLTIWSWVALSNSGYSYTP